MMCELCLDIGWMRNPVPLEHPFFGLLVPCDCKRDERARARLAALLRLSDLSPKMREKYTFVRFRSQTAAHQKAVSYLRPRTETLTEIVSLFGDNRTGKTHLAVAVLNARLDLGLPGLFVETPSMLDTLRAGYDNGAYERTMTLLKNTPFLVLDDLGAEYEKKNGVVSWPQEKLFQVINHRMEWDLGTIITSNLQPKDFPARVGTRLAGQGMKHFFFKTAGE